MFSIIFERKCPPPIPAAGVFRISWKVGRTEKLAGEESILTGQSARRVSKTEATQIERHESSNTA